jgi:hypothetical protein
MAAKGRAVRVISVPKTETVDAVQSRTKSA